MDALPSLSAEACYRAVVARDARFDGRFHTCVKTTGIYCRPVCPARTPLFANVEFVASAAEAEAKGYRACLRCRPETAPDYSAWRGEVASGGAWRGTANTVSRALQMIDEGALDEGDVERLGDRLGVGERHLRRLFRAHLGASPVAVAQTRRVRLAKALLHQTRLPMAEVALASGFGSVRRYNETFQALYGRPPSALRHGAGEETGAGVALSLAWRAPYEFDALMAALSDRGDRVERGVWSRMLDAAVDGTAGRVEVQAGRGNALRVRVEAERLEALPRVLARVRRVFDLGHDPEALMRDLGKDPVLGPSVTARPGLRLPGSWVLDDDAVAPADRWPDPATESLAEGWRPWRAYAALYLTINEESPHAKRA
jgi:AraC family transcriptional regulator of adaptative response / DNA-3-methyladenine glycosylase II